MTKFSKRKWINHLALRSWAMVLFLSIPSMSYAYIGPGLGAGTIGVILGVIGSILLALFAILWYPVKRLFKKRKTTLDEPEQIQVESEAQLQDATLEKMDSIESEEK